MFNNIAKPIVLALWVCLMATGLVASPAGQVEAWDKKTLVTFDQPIEIPGQILPAGTYLFQVVDLLGTRNVVRITNDVGTRVYATLLAVTDFRLEASEETTLIFYEARPNTPEPLRAWFYPGYQYGFEFVYPRKQAAQIAQVSEERVIAEQTPATAPDEVIVPPAVAELFTEPIVAISPAGEESPAGLVNPSRLERKLWEIAALAASQPSEAPRELPRTGSPFPLLAFIGFIAMAAVYGLRVFRG
jgi:hypothetical protein